MTVILPDGIPKVRPSGALREMLRPVLAIEATLDEAGICLCLEDEDRVWTQDQVIDLRQAASVRKDDVVQRRSAQ